MFVRSGSYTGNIVIDKSVSLVGQNKDTTTIIGDKTGTNLLITHDNVRVTGFTVQNPNVTLLMWNRKRGIHLLHANNCSVSGNNVLLNGFGEGIWLYGSSQNVISENVVKNGNHGIVLEGSSDNRIINNVFEATYSGIRFIEPHRNTIVANHVSSYYGVSLYSSGNNVFYANRVSGQKSCVFVSSESDLAVAGVNHFDDGTEGNYWSDYNGRDSNGDGIGDTPYLIDGNLTDSYPLMNPVNISIIRELPYWTVLPLLVTAAVLVLIGKKRLTKTSRTQRLA